jgi:hypothetical protein
MAAPSRPQPWRIVDTIRATLGRGRATLRRLRPATRLLEDLPEDGQQKAKERLGRAT